MDKLPGDNSRPPMSDKAGAKPGSIGGLLNRAKQDDASAWAETPLDARNMSAPGYNFGNNPPPPSNLGPGRFGDPLDRAAGTPSPKGDATQRAFGGQTPPPTPFDATGRGGFFNEVRGRLRNQAYDWAVQQAGGTSVGKDGGQAEPGGPIGAGMMGQVNKKAMAVAAAKASAPLLKYAFTGDEAARAKLGLNPAKFQGMSKWDSRFSAESTALVYGPGSDTAPRHSIDTYTINAWNASATDNVKAKSYDYLNEKPRDVRVINPNEGHEHLTPYSGVAGAEVPKAGAGGISQGAPDFMHAGQTQGGNPWFDIHQQATGGFDIQAPQPIRKPQTP